MARRHRKGLSMRKIGELFRLSMVYHKPAREIARSLSISHTAVNAYLRQAEKVALTYEQIKQMDEDALKKLLRQVPQASSDRKRPQPDWAAVYEDMKKKSVTLQLLWQEYKEVYPNGYQLSKFYEFYRDWKKKLQISLRQDHKAGEKMFVDYAGQTIPVHDRETGEIRQAQIFVSTLGASNYTYSEATWDQKLPSWTSSHIHSFEYFEGVPEVIVVDNLKSGVSRSCRYEPDLNPTYQDMAAHYGCAVIPARARRPKDKAKVEVAVQIVERWILAALRNRIFFSLEELNEAIGELLEKLNSRPFKKLNGSRKEWFEKIDQPALKALPAERYVLAEWKYATVNIDYHVDVEGHYYSVPHGLRGERVEIRYTHTTVEIFFKSRRVTSHVRHSHKGSHTTQSEHMPKSHQQYLEWTPSRMIRWASSIGACTGKIAERILVSREHPEQGFRSCLGMIRLGAQYDHKRLEAACQRALKIGASSYKSIKSILEHGLDRQVLSTDSSSAALIAHENIRGKQYYN